MTAHNSPAIALYEGNARLWQDANLVEAPSIQFDRDRRSLVAQGTAAHPVSTVLVQENWCSLMEPSLMEPSLMKPSLTKPTLIKFSRLNRGQPTMIPGKLNP